MTNKKVENFPYRFENGTPYIDKEESQEKLESLIDTILIPFKEAVETFDYSFDSVTGILTATYHGMERDVYHFIRYFHRDFERMMDSINDFIDDVRRNTDAVKKFNHLKGLYSQSK